MLFITSDIYNIYNSLISFFVDSKREENVPLKNHSLQKFSNMLEVERIMQWIPKNSSSDCNGYQHFVKHVWFICPIVIWNIFHALYFVYHSVCNKVYLYFFKSNLFKRNCKFTDLQEVAKIVERTYALCAISASGYPLPN